MYDNWTEVRNQLDQMLELERAQRQVRRNCQQPSFWHSLWQWWRPTLRLAQGRRRSPTAATVTVTRQR